MPAGATLSTLLDTLGYEPSDIIWIGALDHTPDVEYPFSNLPVKVSAADAVIDGLTAAGRSTYFMVNRSAKTSGKGRGLAQDVTQAMALYVDIDVKDGGMPTWESAGELIDRISMALGNDPVAVVNSGHGLQPYWTLDDEQVTDENRSVVMRLYERFGVFCRVHASLLGGNLDSVFDLPRVLRAPGGVNFKRDPLDVELTITGATTPYSFAQLESVLDEWDIPDVSVVDLGTKISTAAEWAGGAGQSCEWVAAKVDDFSRATPASRHPWMLGAAIEIMSCVRNGCVSMAEGVAGIQRVGERFEQLLQTGTNPRALAKNEITSALTYAIRFVEALTDEQVHEQVGYHIHDFPGPDNPFGSGSADLGTDGVHDGSTSTSTSTPTSTDGAKPGPVSLDEFAYQARLDPTGEAGIAYAVTKALEGRYLLTPEGNVLRWDGHYWADDRLNQFGADFQQALTKYTRDLYSRRQINPETAAKMSKAASSGNGEKLLRRWNRLVVDTMLLNANPLELCTPGGIVDLKTGRVRPAEALTDLNTQITKFAPEIGAPSRWLAFLKQMIEDDERIEYLQRILGSSLVGDQRWPDLPIFVGKGDNGKSVILTVIGRIMAGYATAMPEGFLTQRSGSQHPTELADLRGKRLATQSEVDPHGTFNESRLKALTGGDPIRARKMRQDFEEFVPTHMFLIALNHLLQLPSGGDSIFRRIRLITFDVQVPKHQIDVELPQKLLEEGGRILTWLIEGARKALEFGLTPPRRVADDTLQYRYEEDHVANFAAEMLTPKPDGRVARDEVMRAYTRWCRLMVQDPLPSATFFRELPAKIDLKAPGPTDPRHLIYGVVLTADIDQSHGFVQPATDYPRSNDD